MKVHVSFWTCPFSEQIYQDSTFIGSNELHVQNRNPPNVLSTFLGFYGKLDMFMVTEVIDCTSNPVVR